ncbi:MAG: hypothetical protein MZV63_61855 [Marinilabiliales bacterium]|nr:hypothetical protein [Marinilabiliales bacterium]
MPTRLATSPSLSADYEFIDYGSARLKDGSDGYDFYNENEDLVSELANTGNLRLGAEVRMDGLYLRGGYSYIGSAFQEGTLNEGCRLQRLQRRDRLQTE